MSDRSIYLRDQADKCRSFASQMSDPETQSQLRKRVIEYAARAAEIEGAEIAAETVAASSPPSLWLPASQAQDIKHQAG
jgi:hypothetical protein